MLVSVHVSWCVRYLNVDVDIFFIIRTGMRAFGVVRSEAELNELAYELYAQEEVYNNV